MVKSLNYEEYGGAVFLGVDGLIIKCHGSSKSKAIKSAVTNAYDLAKGCINFKIEKAFENMEVKDIDNDR